MEDADILKVLQNIEKLLKSNIVGNQKTLPQAKTSADRAKETASQRQGKETSKAFKATAVAARTTQAAMMGLGKDFQILNSEVSRVTSSFGSLNSEMHRFLTTLQIPLPTPDPIQPSNNNINDTKVDSFIARQDSLLNDILKIVQSPDQQSSPQTTQNPISQALNQNRQAFSNILRNNNRQHNQAPHYTNVPFKTTMLNFTASLGKTTGIIALAAEAIEGMLEVLQKVTVDFFSLSRIGLGSMENLKNMSINAALAGMSLQEYTQIVKDNSVIASRSGSMENFDKLTSSVTDNLKVLGIFGSEAKALQASLANSLSSMGVPQEMLSNAMTKQVQLFDRLRKSTNMTADEFGQLVKAVSESDQAQRELVGLAPKERQVRQEQLLAIQSTGYKLGLAAEASRKLADALISQRGETVKQRFEAAGRVRQMSAFAGMGSEGERAAQIIMKGRRASEQELQELRIIAGKLDASAQNMYEVGSFGTQNVIDELENLISNTAFGKIKDANRPAELAQQSAQQFNRDFGQHVGEFGQTVGQLLTWGRGFTQSIGPSILAAVGGTLAAIFAGPLLRLASSVIGKMSPQFGAALTTAASNSTSAISLLKTPIQALGSVMSSVLSPVQSFLNGIKGIASTFSTTKSAFGAGVATIEAIVTGVSGFGSAVVGIAKGLYGFLKAFGVWGGLIDAVIEMFTGKMSDALNPSGGFANRVNGILMAFLTAIPNFIISTMEWVFGEQAMKGVQNFFDRFVALFSYTFNKSMAKLYGGISDIISYILPNDSGLAKSMKSIADNTNKSAEENWQTYSKLLNDQNATLSSISAENAKKNTESVKEVSSQTRDLQQAQQKFNNVQYGLQLDKNALIQEANTASVAPKIQTPLTITPVDVNKEKTEVIEKVSNITSDSPEMIALLQTVVNLLTQNLSIQTQQAEYLGIMTDGQRPRAEFTSSEVIANKLLNVRV